MEEFSLKKLIVKLMSLILVAIIIAGTVLAGCSDSRNVQNNDSQKSSQEEIVLSYVGVKIIGPDSEEIVNTIAVGVFEKANEVLNECFNQNSIMCDGLDNNFITSINGIENTQTDGWVLYIDGNISDVGVNDAKVVDGTNISLEWKNYDEAFK